MGHPALKCAVTTYTGETLLLAWPCRLPAERTGVCQAQSSEVTNEQMSCVFLGYKSGYPRALGCPGPQWDVRWCMCVQPGAACRMSSCWECTSPAWMSPIVPSDAAHTIKTSTNNSYQHNPPVGVGSVSNCSSQASISLFAVTAERFAVSRGCFHPGNSPFAVSQLAGVTAVWH